MIYLVWLIAVAGASDEVTGDLKRLQGTWQAAGFVIDGKELAAKDREALKLVIKGTRGTFTRDDKQVHGTYALDEAASPKTIDITLADGPDKGKKKLGIYEIKDGVLRLCVGPVGGKRPTKFESAADSGVWLEEWKRPR